MMIDWHQQFVVLKNGTKLLTTVYNVDSDSMLSYQKGFILQDSVRIAVSREGQEGKLHIWQEDNGATQHEQNALTMSDLFLTSTSASSAWRYRATLRGTGFDAYSRYSEEDAVKNVCERMIPALDGSYVPLVLTFRGWIALVWRDPNHQWGFTSFALGSDGVHYLEADVSGCTSRTDALRQARLSLARQTWDGEEESCPLLIEPKDQQWFTQWVRERKQEREQR
ncbi:hypothetical protein KSF_107770 [Reticulibacter mediterranei]|uniref:Uncharacterized protein n=1 Tax=Reticulibacter mediterranei TaxID=2778369 RepID=A0A8J3IZB0_9CHLR|nr:hypothetical protein [Reticulibacter mediterranei]GHP00730.1 hypothetical protein KSF_107770 [Reticulibacter mediterranei]